MELLSINDSIEDEHFSLMPPGRTHTHARKQYLRVFLMNNLNISKEIGDRLVVGK